MQVSRKSNKKRSTLYPVFRSDFDHFIEGLEWQLEQSGNCIETLYDVIAMQLQSFDTPNAKDDFVLRIRHWLQNTGWLGWLKEKNQAQAFLDILN